MDDGSVIGLWSDDVWHGLLGEMRGRKFGESEVLGGVGLGYEMFAFDGTAVGDGSCGGGGVCFAF